MSLDITPGMMPDFKPQKRKRDNNKENEFLKKAEKKRQRLQQDREGALITEIKRDEQKIKYEEKLQERANKVKPTFKALQAAVNQQQSDLENQVPPVLQNPAMAQFVKLASFTNQGENIEALKAQHLELQLQEAELREQLATDSQRRDTSRQEQREPLENITRHSNNIANASESGKIEQSNFNSNGQDYQSSLQQEAHEEQLEDITRQTKRRKTKGRSFGNNIDESTNEARSKQSNPTDTQIKDPGNQRRELLQRTQEQENITNRKRKREEETLEDITDPLHPSKRARSEPPNPNGPDSKTAPGETAPRDITNIQSNPQDQIKGLEDPRTILQQEELRLQQQLQRDKQRREEELRKQEKKDGWMDTIGNMWSLQNAIENNTTARPSLVDSNGQKSSDQASQQNLWSSNSNNDTGEKKKTDSDDDSDDDDSNTLQPRSVDGGGGEGFSDGGDPISEGTY